MTLLENTNANKIAGALVEARRRAGSPAMSMVMTLVIEVPEEDAEDALEAARAAAREHPARLLAVVIGPVKGPSSIVAEIGTGVGAAGEHALIKLSGEVARHPESVVLPLLLPDSPVVVWWPTDAPKDPAADPLGQLASRRITDASRVKTGRTRAMLKQCAAYAPGNTDLAWTRITPWRALLAAAMDQVDAQVSRITVAAEKVSPSADLLSAWLTDRLKAPVTRTTSEGPGITDVVLVTGQGEIRVSRPDGRLATLTVPGQPDRPMALRRREVPALLAEELRRLDPDDVYEATVRRLAKLSDQGGSGRTASTKREKGAKDRSARATVSGRRDGTVEDDDAGSGTGTGTTPDPTES